MYQNEIYNRINKTVGSDRLIVLVKTCFKLFQKDRRVEILTELFFFVCTCKTLWFLFFWQVLVIFAAC